LRHIHLAILGSRHPDREVLKFRKHLVWYTKGLKNASQFRIELMKIKDPDELIRQINFFFD
jgi:tRNA-dihydrouridine synthase